MEGSVGSVKFPQSRMKGERHRLSPLSPLVSSPCQMSFAITWCPSYMVNYHTHFSSSETAEPNLAGMVLGWFPFKIV